MERNAVQRDHACIEQAAIERIAERDRLLLLVHDSNVRHARAYAPTRKEVEQTGGHMAGH